MIAKELLLAALLLLALRIPTTSRRRDDRRSSGNASRDVSSIARPATTLPPQTGAQANASRAAAGPTTTTDPLPD